MSLFSQDDFHFPVFDLLVYASRLWVFPRRPFWYRSRLCFNGGSAPIGLCCTLLKIATKVVVSGITIFDTIWFQPVRGTESPKAALIGISVYFPHALLPLDNLI